MRSFTWSLHFSRAIKGAFDFVVRVGGDGVVAPEPAEHFGQDGAALFLSVQADAPGVVDVVAFFGHGFDEADVLEEPVALGVIVAAAASAGIIVAAVLKEDAERFFFACG